MTSEKGAAWPEMFEKLCSRTFSSASNCQFFLWLWPPPKKRDLWNSDRGLYGKAQREEKTEERSEGVPRNQCEGRAGCQSQRSVDLSIQRGSARAPSVSFRPFHTHRRDAKNICAWEVFPLGG
ncbi:hypothetical protein Q8A67_015108 [Cirrhinus molitorella]|uniref:Uncharacterized protein n=1 Tax=Cirrhinus molitorella TaxID=172907 RepID=A0AA88TJR7_9TELE|nr:hypothetical protein Q8A67_015108 [Cirrhinus molitorella]